MRKISLGAVTAAMVAVHLVSSLTPADAKAKTGEKKRPWLVVVDGARVEPQESGTYGGVCSVGVNHRIAKDVYPRTVYYTGGARCVSNDQPATVFQDAQAVLWQMPNSNLVDRGRRERGYTDWSISQGAYPGAEKTQRYRVVVDVELQTPDGSNWANFGGDDCQGAGTPVVKCHVVGRIFKVT